ncbi:MAG: type IV pilus modification PilV family protein [Armatimonadota bacterium]
MLCRHMRRPAGFTLLEMLVAMVLLTVGITGTMGALSGILQGARLADDYTTASLLAQSRLTELEQVDGLVEGTAEGDFGEDYPGWRWEQEVIQAESEGLLQVTVTVIWQRGAEERTYTVTTYRLQPPEETTTGTEETSQ